MHRIDPRIVIIQIVLSGICAFWIFKPLAMLCEVLFLMSFLLYLQHPKEALRLGVWFAFLVGLYALLNESNAPQIIYASFVFSFIDSIVAMFPVGAVFYTLTKIQNNKAFTGNDWLVLFGILIISLVVRMVFKYLVYSFQSTAGFEFVSRERITLGDKLRNVGMGFFHERNMGDITTTVTTDLNFLENYSMQRFYGSSVPGAENATK